MVSPSSSSSRATGAGEGSTSGCSAAAVHPPVEVQTTLVAAAQHPEVLPSPAPVALLLELEGDTIRYDLEFWIPQPARAPYVTSDVRRRIWELFAARGIAMSAPQDVVLVRGGE